MWFRNELSSLAKVSLYLQKANIIRFNTLNLKQLYDTDFCECHEITFIQGDSWLYAINMKTCPSPKMKLRHSYRYKATSVFFFLKCDIPIVFYKFNMYSVQLAVKTQLIYCTVCTMYKNYMFRPLSLGYTKNLKMAKIGRNM